MLTSIESLLVIVLFVLTSHYLAVFLHEYTHSFAAWLLGYKHNPLDIKYGGTSWPNLLLLSNIDENVNYKVIIASGHRWYAAIIALAGSWVANGGYFFYPQNYLEAQLFKVIGTYSIFFFYSI